MINKTKELLNKDIDLFSKKDVILLQDVVKYHSDLYHNKGIPIISDYEYDILLKKLYKLEEKFDISEKISSKIGEETKESSFEKVKHSKPMISLDNTYNEDDLIDFDKRVKKLVGSENGVVNNIGYIIEFKFDGLGIELIYKDGIFIQAITRGNGIEGEDVTENVRQIDNIPKKIDYKGNLELRGEVIFPISEFKKLNKQREKLGETLFSNPRNAASGSLRTLDINVTRSRNLKYFGYDIPNYLDFGAESYFDLIKKIDDFGFETSIYFKVCENIEEVIKEINNFGDIKKTIDFDIDGLVIKVNDINLWNKVGMTEHHPRYAIAYKFPAEIITTKLLGVEYSVGRTGTITPVALLQEVNIGGVLVKRASLHNFLEVKNKDIRIGDYVFIKRAGEVIPEVISVIKDSRLGNEKEILPPQNCPSCQEKIVKDDNKVRYYCPNNLFCESQIIENLAYTVGKSGFNIDGFGIKQVELFLKLGFIKNIVDIFYLKEKREELLALEGFKEKSVSNLINSIEKSKNLNISKFITALGISGVGKKTSKEISKIFKSKEDLLNFNYSLEELQNLKDVGIETAKNIFYYFTALENKENLSKLLNILNIQFDNNKIVKLEKEGKYFGKKICITGSFDNYKRDNLIKILENNGGEFVSSISKNTDFLLAGEKSGSKLEKANKLGIKIISLEEFLDFRLK